MAVHDGQLRFVVRKFNFFFLSSFSIIIIMNSVWWVVPLFSDDETGWSIFGFWSRLVFNMKLVSFFLYRNNYRSFKIDVYVNCLRGKLGEINSRLKKKNSFHNGFQMARISVLHRLSFIILHGQGKFSVLCDFNCYRKEKISIAS